MAPIPVIDGPEQIVFQGKIVEVVKQPMKIGSKTVEFEFARRSPGTRLIIVNNKEKKILVTKEFRSEHNDYDYRLPGGKVFDSLEEYNEFLSSGKDILIPATKQAKVEAKEEAGLEVKNIKHYYTSVNGATVTWDLYYFVIDDWEEKGQELGEGEDIEVMWINFEQAQKFAFSGSMSEDRSVAILLRWLNEHQ